MRKSLPYQGYPQTYPIHGRPYIVVHSHDVLSGRGVNIAQHPGNERFRALVNSRHDNSYCTAYSTSEKRAVAEEIITHIRALKPPGRFLKRTGRSQSARGLNGPWEELTARECMKKTCQALRDCNRTDRQGYAAQVSVPVDVQEHAEKRSATGLTMKEHAAAAVAAASPSLLHPHHVNLNPPSHPPYDATATGAMTSSSQPSTTSPSTTTHYHLPTSTSAVTAAQQHHNHTINMQKRVRSEYSDDTPIAGGGRVSPSVENAAEWLKKQRTDDSRVAGGNATTSIPDMYRQGTTVTTTTSTSPPPHVSTTPVTSSTSANITPVHPPYQVTSTSHHLHHSQQQHVHPNNLHPSNGSNRINNHLPLVSSPIPGRGGASPLTVQVPTEAPNFPQHHLIRRGGGTGDDHHPELALAAAAASAASIITPYSTVGILHSPPEVTEASSSEAGGGIPQHDDGATVLHHGQQPQQYDVVHTTYHQQQDQSHVCMASASADVAATADDDESGGVNNPTSIGNVGEYFLLESDENNTNNNTNLTNTNSNNAMAVGLPELQPY